MPSVRQGGGYTLTFSRKNQDVREMLEEEKKNGAIISDFICEAIRFYVQNRNQTNVNTIQKTITNNIDMKHIENLIEQKIKESLATVTKEPNRREILENTSNMNSSDFEED